MEFDFRNDYDNFQGSCETISYAGQLETQRDFCNRCCAWKLLGIDDSRLLLGHDRFQLLLSKHFFAFLQIYTMQGTLHFSINNSLLLKQDKFKVRPIKNNEHEKMAALYLQVSIVSQALIFVTRSRSWSFVERPGLLLVSAFIAAQLVCHYYFYHASFFFLINLIESSN